jgi:RNA polymerase sigma-70 factor, ECF subfamily
MTPSISHVVSEHAGFVWRALVHLGISENQIKDTSQEVFLIALQRLGEFEGRSSVRTWLYGICRNVATDTRRRERRRPELATHELPETIMMPAQEGVVWAKEAHAQLVRALDHLDEDQRLVFILFEVEQLTMEEIADATLTPLRTCYSRLQAARNQVRAELRRHEHLSHSPRTEVSR